jgi:hypothetical protein
MAWIILFLPISIGMGIVFIAKMDLLSIACVAITTVIFALLELRWVSREPGRSKLPWWIMCMINGSVLLGVIWKYWLGNLLAS